LNTFGYGPVSTRGNYLQPEFDLPEDLDLMRELITSRERITATLMNNREIAIYVQTENLTGQQWFNETAQLTGQSTQYKVPYRKAFDVISANGGNFISPGTTISIGHGLTGITAVTRIWGAATTSNQEYLMLPYCDPTALNLGIAIKANQTNIVVINGAGQGSIIQLYAVFEYLKQT